jgi:TonB family protein
MSDSPNQWVGQIVDSKFPLQQFLGGTNHSAVFLTQLPEAPTQTCALKLIQLRPADADRQLSRWREAAQLSHPNLLRVFDSGRCEVSGMNFLYLVTEHAPEDLSQILPQRALTPDETRDMLQPVLNALAYLHQENLLHGHVTPSNILAIDDVVKLSADSIFPASQSRVDSRELDAYDAPELATPSVSSPADIFSLGATLVEVLTQKLPVRQDTLEIDPTFSRDIPEPFLEIVRRSLRLDSTRRWTIEGISAHLTPKPAMAVAAGASPSAAASTTTAAPVNAIASSAASSSGPALSPLAVPLSHVAPLPAPKLPEPRSYSIPPETRRAPQTSNSKPRFLLLAIAAVLFFAALLYVPKLLNRRGDTSASVATAIPSRTDAPPAPPNSSANPASPKSKSTASPAKNSSASTPAPAPPNSSANPASPKSKSTASPAKNSSASTPAPAPLQPASTKERLDRAPSANVATPPVIPSPRSAANASDSAPISKSPASPRGEVLDQILPQISDRARSTIQGKVRVAIRVQVDAAGNVSDAQFDSPGPSKTFADLALDAARKWEFTPPEFSGHSVPSIWTIRFEIGPSDTKVLAKQIDP